MSVKNSKQRQCGKNFDYSEELLILDLVEGKKDVLENKKSDAVTWKQKNDCWEKLAIEFASQTGSARSVKTLKDKFENLKRKCKVELAAEKRESYRTGGVPRTQNVSDVSERVASLIGDSAVGLNNLFDSDFSNNNEGSSNSDIQMQYESLLSEKETVDLEIAYDRQDEAETSISSAFNPKWNPTQLKQAKSQKLVLDEKPNRKKSLEEERLLFIKLQQEFYRNENIRAAEKHKEELKNVLMRNELLQLEIEEKRKKLH